MEVVSDDRVAFMDATATLSPNAPRVTSPTFMDAGAVMDAASTMPPKPAGAASTPGGGFRNGNAGGGPRYGNPGESMEEFMF
jgi:hypothetical protein